MEKHSNTPVIIVTEEQKRRKGLLWLAGITAGAVALVGGGTFALWSASDTFDGGQITAGDLNIEITSDGFFDISEDRTDKDDVLPGTEVPAHAIDPEDWRIVPGDTVALAVEAEITLVGDNLVAELILAADSDDADFTNEYIEWSFQIFMGEEAIEIDDADEFSLAEFIEDGEMTLAFLTTPLGRDGVYGDDTLPGVVFPVLEDDSTVITVVIIGRFLQAGDLGGNNPDPDGALGGRDDEHDAGRNLEDTFGAMTFRLEQVRDTSRLFTTN